MPRYLIVVVAFLLLGVTARSEERLQVRVDPRIELMAVTQIMADYGWTRLLANQSTAYRRDVDAWFAPFRDHPAVKRFAEMAKQGYNFDGPAGTMVCLTDPPELKLEGNPEECGAGRAGGADSLIAWLDQLRDLARTSNFSAFFQAHAGFYQLMEEQTRQKLARDYAADLEAYHGIRHASYTIVIAPLLVGNYGPRHRRPDGRFDIYSVLGTDRATEGIAQFGSRESLKRLVWHEFGHSFSNPEVDALRPSVAKSSKLLDPIAEKMSAAAYGDWHTAVIEHVNRAVEVRLAFRELGDDGGEQALDFQMAQGFAYVGALVERLREYEQNRDLYPTLHDFAARLISVFDELAARNLPPDFYEIPPTISGGLGGQLVFVIPTAEYDRHAQQKIVEYVTMVRDHLAKQAEILTDQQALTRDLSSYSVHAFGTLSGNKWLAKHRDEIPPMAAFMALSEASPLRLIAALPDPQSSKVLGVAYTATEAAAVPGIGSLSLNLTAYVIGKDMEVIKSGYYRRHDSRWLLK